MTALTFLEVAVPVLLITLLLIAVLFLLTRLVKESRQDAQHWQRIVTTLRCAACGSAYDSWDRATWGIDADPPDSVQHDHGILLQCPHCRWLRGGRDRIVSGIYEAGRDRWLVRGRSRGRNTKAVM